MHSGPPATDRSLHRLRPPGRLWFTEHLDIDFQSWLDAPVSLGFVAADWSYTVHLPPLLAIDGTTGDIWFAEYFRHRLARLRRL